VGGIQVDLDRRIDDLRIFCVSKTAPNEKAARQRVSPAALWRLEMQG
jgi:hypothetical protein